MLRLDQLTLSDRTGRQLLQDVSLCIRRGETIGLTGESGAGKSSVLKVLLGVHDASCQLSGGSIQATLVQGGRMERLNEWSPQARRQLNGTTIGYIPQNPLAAFDSRLLIGRQMEAIYRVKLGMARNAARQWADEQLHSVGLVDTAGVRRSWPHQLSGGMLQRVAIAILLGMDPPYVLADEPTASLDPHNRKLVLELLAQCSRRSGILLVTHDVEAMLQLCSRIAVMHNGAIVEEGPPEQLLAQPAHPWTKMLAKRWQAVHGRGMIVQRAVMHKGGDASQWSTSASSR